MTAYFERVLQLPLSFHGGLPSDRLMKAMLGGTDALWWLWLGFFREHLAAFISLLVPAWGALVAIGMVCAGFGRRRFR